MNPITKPRPHNRRKLAFILGPILFLVVCSYVGSALAPKLVNDQPALLIALSPRIRHLLLAAPNLAAGTFFTVGFIRLLIADPLFYLLGREYGDAGLRWMERQVASTRELFEVLERWFPKKWVSWPLIAIAPNEWICMMSGATRVPPAVFLTLNVAGTISRLLLIRLFTDAFDGFLNDVLGGIGRYAWPLTALSVAVVVWQVVQARRHRRLETIGEIERDLTGYEAEADVAYGVDGSGDDSPAD